ncbi:hypothetical protein LCGC14_1900620 [marine sediment metagenome]|uniref:Uncharacterized protein n=1 Tax=marine sediment metagenome TaxID=412755 RepID=A0A0F9GK30_9ZZZZ
MGSNPASPIVTTIKLIERFINVHTLHIIMNEQKYEGWLTSKKLWKRSLAVIGHDLFGQLMILSGIGILILAFGGIWWIFQLF